MYLFATNKIIYIMKFIKCVLPVYAVLILCCCRGKQDTKEEILRPVKYHVVGTADAQKVRTFSGFAQAGNEIALSFRSSGVISKVNVKKGQKVRKGDLMARLDNVEASLAYEKSVSALSSAESDMNTAKTELDRIKSLYEKNTVSLSDYESAKNGYQNALAQFESAKRNKSIQQTQVNYGYIYAPSDGIIANTEGAVNERVSAGHVFAILNAGDKMKIEVGLPENVINLARLGMKTGITFTAIGGKSFEGSVIEISPIVVDNAATFPVDVEIVNPTADIRPGMAANVTFNFGNGETVRDNILVVPIKAVGEDGNGNFVFIIDSDDGKTGLVKRQQVEIGQMTTAGFEIKSGLSQGQFIATAGLQTLLNGQKVRLQ